MILIGPELKQALAAITCCCDLPINWGILGQIEHDARENQVVPKQYVLHDSKRNHLSATVDAYEPETVTLRLVRGRSKQFESIVTAASAAGFGKHAYFLDRPSSPPKNVATAISTAHQPFISKRPLMRMALVAIDGTNAICRCFLGGTRIKPTPYCVYAVNLRSMNAKKLNRDDAEPFSIRGYR